MVKEIGKLFYTIAIKGTEKVESDLKNTEKTTENSASKMLSAFKKIGAGVATYFTFGAIKQFGQEITSLAAEVSAEASAFEQIMGDYAQNAQDKMNQLAETTGMVSSRLTPYMTSMTAKFKGLGYDIETATTLATDGLTLASDAAAFWDKSLDESVSHLNSFINGSYEGGEAIGLFANDTQMAAYAIKKGLVEETKEWSALEESIKQATRLEYAQAMFAQSGATGQAAKESSQYANVQANLTEKWRQFKAQIGEPLLQNVVIPAIEKLSVVVDVMSEGFETSKEKLKDLYEWYQKNKTAIDLLAIAIGSLTTGLTIYKVSTMTATIATKAQTLATKLQTVAQKLLNTTMWSSPYTWVTAAILALVGGFMYLWENCEGFREFWMNLWDNIKQITSEVVTKVTTYFQELWNGAVNIFNSLKETVINAWETIKNVVQVAIMFIAELLGFGFDLITIPFRFIWENCKEYIITAWENIKTSVNDALMWISEKVSGIWNTISSTLKPIIDGIKNFISDTWNSIKTQISETIQAISATISGIWNSVKTFCSNIWKAIKKSIYEEITGIKNDVSSGINAAKKVLDEVLTKIKEKFNSIFEDAKNIVKKAIEKIKSFFNFSWNLPKLKMPHISIKGEFSLFPPKVPDFGIEWYAKGGILNKPTIFGANGNNLMAGGEAGPEAVAPISNLMDYVRIAVDDSNSRSIELLENILEFLTNTIPQQQNIVLDNGVLVGQLAPSIDEALGTIRKRGNR